MEGEEKVKPSVARTLSTCSLALVTFGPFVFWAYFVKRMVNCMNDNIPGVHNDYLIAIWCIIMLAAVTIIIVMSFKYYFPGVERIMATKKKKKDVKK